MIWGETPLFLETPISYSTNVIFQPTMLVCRSVKSWVSLLSPATNFGTWKSIGLQFHNSLWTWGQERRVLKNAQNQMLLFLPQSWKWKMGPSKISFLYISVIFHFHIYGRMGNSTPLFQIYVSVRISFYSELYHLLGNLFLLHPFWSLPEI